jgi:hypothetical protein
MSLYDNVKKLRELLDQYPKMENPEEFDNELEKRRKVYRDIKEEIDKLGSDMENTWTDNAWKNVKNKKGN